MAGKKYFKRKRTKKSYRKKYGKKTFRAKRIGNKMIGTEQRPVRWKVGQLVALNYTQYPLVSSYSPACTIAFLNNPANATFVQTIRPNNLNQTVGQFAQMTGLYDEFTCTGVRVKFFQVRNLGGNTMLNQEIIQDNNSIFNPADANTANMNVYGNYQTIPMNQNQSWTRYYSMARLKKQLGIGWCNTSDTNFTYYGQLATTTNPSMSIRTNWIGAIAPNTKYTTVEVTYYYMFRGLKAASLGATINMPQIVEEPVIKV